MNITCMMVLTSVYLSVSSSLPPTPNIKPVEIWLLFNVAYPFLVIVASCLLQVWEKENNIHTLPSLFRSLKKGKLFCPVHLMKKSPQKCMDNRSGALRTCWHFISEFSTLFCIVYFLWFISCFIYRTTILRAIINKQNKTYLPESVIWALKKKNFSPNFCISWAPVRAKNWC